MPHRFDLGINIDSRVQLTPLDGRPRYSRRCPALLILKDDILVELALLLKYGNVATLSFSKNSSQKFAQNKPKGKQRLLVDLRQKNNLRADDYINKNHPVSTLTDAAQHRTQKNCSANRTLPNRISAYTWLISNQLDFSFSTSQAERLHAEDWRKDSVGHCQHFRASFMNTLIQESKQTNVHKTLMRL